LSQEAVPHYVDALRRYRVTHLVGYSSALHTLAEEALRSPSGGFDLEVVITNAEPLFDHQRAAIGRAFSCPVRETYGMAELVAAASECEAGRLHLWPEVGRVEILEEGRPAAPGRSGALVCTGLFNVDMPLIRYRVGDSATACGGGAPCACGRRLPVLDAIDGRLDDLVYARDGRPVGRLDPVFKSQLPIKEAQIIQERLDRVRVRYVPAPEFNAATGAEVARRLRDRLGDVDVVLEEVERVPRDAGGKLRGVICALSADERHAVARV
jgi:phenylacetate-CoA ligase